MRSNRYTERTRTGDDSSRLRFIALAVWFFVLVMGGEALAQTAALPTITTAQTAHELDAARASRAYPVCLHAVVTFYDEHLDSTGTPVLFVTDSSGSIYVALRSKPAVPPRPGDLVEITGVTGAGLFAPIVAHGEFRVLGVARLPTAAPRVILSDMSNGRYEGQWVEVEGLVRAVRHAETHVILDLLLRDGTTTAITARRPDVDYSRFTDARIILQGHSSPNFNRQKQVTGAHLLFPNLSTVRIVEPGTPDPFALPADRIGDLLRFDPQRTFQHRIHLRGALTLLWPGKMICIEDASQGLCAETHQTLPLPVGEETDITGFPEIGPFTPTLANADYRDAGGHQAVAAPEINAEEALHGDHDARMVQIEGLVIDDSTKGDERVLTLSSGAALFTVTVPYRPSDGNPPKLENRTRVRVRGICSVQSGGTTLGTGEGFSIPKSFNILAGSMEDVTILARPSWWNAAHSLAVLIAVLSVTVLAVCGLVILRLRVRQQTATIRAQLEETHALKEAAEFQATHDSLTGLLNRRAILDMLQREISLSSRAGRPTGVIMLDLDHFKRINDTYGHAAGDEVIRETVRRMLPSVRSTDWIGRYGGEEFLVVLTECDLDAVGTCAERIRVAIGNGAVNAAGNCIPVTASLGATIALPPMRSTEEVLSVADLALYEAKNSGRNRVCFRDVDRSLPGPALSLPSEPRTSVAAVQAHEPRTSYRERTPQGVATPSSTPVDPRNLETSVT